MSAPLTRAAFEAISGVSRETSDRLAAYVDLLQRWNQRINLVGRSTLDDPWRRHILDSTQLASHLPAGGGRVVDIGSGAGLPGLPLALTSPSWRVAMIESDQRKAAFIREALRVTGATAELRVARIESIDDITADVVTARALAPLDRLIAYARRFLRPDGVCILLKGRNAQRELTDSVQDMIVSLEQFESASGPDGAVLRFALRAMKESTSDGERPRL